MFDIIVLKIFGGTMRLFKYFQITDEEDDKTLQNLEKNQIYFKQVNQVNDPYEGIIDFEVIDELKEDFLKFFYREKYDTSLLLKFPFEEMKRDIIARTITSNILIGSGIACFSNSNESLVMWGNYADKHTGICIEYNPNIGLFRHVKEVVYSEEILSIPIRQESDLNKKNIYEKAKQCIFQKHEEWRYEKEWRLLDNPGNTIGYPPEAIKAIYLGNKISDKNKKRVYDSLRHLKYVEFFKTDFYQHKYKVRFLIDS
jgi:hypothetical protein